MPKCLHFWIEFKSSKAKFLPHKPSGTNPLQGRQDLTFMLTFIWTLLAQHSDIKVFLFECCSNKFLSGPIYSLIKLVGPQSSRFWRCLAIVWNVLTPLRIIDPIQNTGVSDMNGGRVENKQTPHALCLRLRYYNNASNNITISTPTILLSSSTPFQEIYNNLATAPPSQPSASSPKAETVCWVSNILVLQCLKGLEVSFESASPTILAIEKHCYACAKLAKIVQPAHHQLQQISNKDVGKHALTWLFRWFACCIFAQGAL